MTNAVNNAIQLSPATVHQHVQGKTKVLDAVRASGLLQDPAVAPYAAEIVAVLNKLSAAHNRKILHALDNALGAGQTVRVEWALAGAIDVDVAPSDAGVVVITLYSKLGTEYLGGSTPQPASS
jgi:hypothetical protein